METVSILELGWQAWLALGVVVGVFGLLVATRLPSDTVFLGGLAVLFLSGVLSAKEALAGFSSQGMITVGVLYVAVAGLQETGGLLWISSRVLGRPRSPRRAQLRLMAPVAGLSAFLNNTPVVALFIPAVMEWSRRIRVQPSRLLIPLSYASILGGVCTLIGTSTNLVVNGLVQTRYGGEGLGMFEITKLGLPLAAAGLAFILLAPRLLPDRKAFGEVVENPREYTLEMQITGHSPLIGKTIEQGGLRHLPGAYVAELIRGERIISAVGPDTVLQEGDRLVFVGHVDSVRSIYQQQGLRPAQDQLFHLDAPRHERCLVEAVVSSTCPLRGQSIRAGRFRQRYNAVVIAAARGGQRIEGRIGDIVLQPGDTLLVESHAGFISRQRDSRDFYLVSAVEDSTPKRHDRSLWAFGILAAMVIVVAFSWLTMLQAGMAAAGLMLLTGCCSPAQARRSIEWDVLLTIAAALGLGLALETTGAARALAGGLLSLTGDQPWLALAMVYLTTTVFTEVITNNAAAALVFPVAMNTAEGLDVSVMPFVICVMVAASASFATPIGYQTNLMVYGPGGYRFSDYLRIGLPLNVLMGVLAVGLAPLIWNF
ncbi:MAG TPA: SLC13 family permease [Candidatus Krumholzibacteria bacterium]|nr:SLC13 family permease [Candidatus Krumholzibacteria bacterium]HRX51526.1 SLC13 family permease [Candidatus Krumholzibacteria bacterium]